METINVELDFDNNRIDYAAFAMYQVLSTLDSGYNIVFYLITRHVTDFSFMEKLKELFPEKLLSFTIVDFDDYLENTSLYKVSYKGTCLPNIVCSKFYLFDIFPSLNRVIHIHEDILIRRSISEFWEYDKESPLVGTEAYVEPATHPADIYHLRLYSLDCKDWINSGIIILDVKYFREHNMFEQFVNVMTIIDNFDRGFNNKTLDVLEALKVDKIAHTIKDFSLYAGVDERALNILYKDTKHTIKNTNKFNYRPYLTIGIIPSMNYSHHGMPYCQEDDIVICHWCSSLSDKSKPWSGSFIKDKYAQEWSEKYTEYTKIMVE